MEAPKEIKEEIENADSILLVTKNNNPNRDLISALFSLFYTLKRIGKKVNIYPETIKEKFLDLPHPVGSLNSYLLEISPADYITELYYQKDSQSLKLLLTSPNAELSLDNLKLFSLKNEPVNPDLIISVGVQSLEELGEYYEKNFKTFFEGFILNIDNQKSNLDFGQINWVEENASLSEMVYHIVQLILPNTSDKLLLENLLSGMISFYQKRPEKILQILDLIKEKSLDFGTIISPFAKNIPPETLTFFEKVLKRIKIIDNNIPFVVINQQEAKNRQKIISFIKMMRSDLFKFPSLLVLWKNRSDLSSFGGVFYFPEKEKLLKIASIFKGKTNGKVVLFQLPKNKLEELIKEISV